MALITVFDVSELNHDTESMWTYSVTLSDGRTIIHGASSYQAAQNDRMVFMMRQWLATSNQWEQVGNHNHIHTGRPDKVIACKDSEFGEAGYFVAVEFGPCMFVHPVHSMYTARMFADFLRGRELDTTTGQIRDFDNGLYL